MSRAAEFVGKTVNMIGQVSRRLIGGKGRAAVVTATEVEVTHAGQILSVS